MAGVFYFFTLLIKRGCSQTLQVCHNYEKSVVGNLLLIPFVYPLKLIKDKYHQNFINLFYFVLCLIEILISK